MSFLSVLPLRQAGLKVAARFGLVLSTFVQTFGRKNPFHRDFME